MGDKIAQLKTGPLRGYGPLGLENDSGGLSSIGLFSTFLSTVIGVMTVIGIIWFVIQFFSGAIGILSSGGDKAKLSEAKGKITSAITGLVVVIVAIFAIQFIGQVLGIPSILDIPTFIKCLGPGGPEACSTIL